MKNYLTSEQEAILQKLEDSFEKMNDWGGEVRSLREYTIEEEIEILTLAEEMLIFGKVDDLEEE